MLHWINGAITSNTCNAMGVETFVKIISAVGVWTIAKIKTLGFVKNAKVAKNSLRARYNNLIQIRELFRETDRPLIMCAQNMIMLILKIQICKNKINKIWTYSATKICTQKPCTLHGAWTSHCKSTAAETATFKLDWHFVSVHVVARRYRDLHCLSCGLWCWVEPWSAPTCRPDETPFIRPNVFDISFNMVSIFIITQMSLTKCKCEIASADVLHLQLTFYHQ